MNPDMKPNVEPVAPDAIPSAIVLVSTTVDSREAARRLARTLLERHLAACAHITEIESLYWWKGALQQEPEYRILFKTTAERYAEVEAALLELHPYELPAIYASALERVYAPYAAWVAEHSSGPGAT